MTADNLDRIPDPGEYGENGDAGKAKVYIIVLTCKNNGVINADGTTCETTGGVVVNYKVDGNYNHINLILNSGNWDEYADKRVILCAYYVEKGEVYYLCDREVATQSAGYITYNELKN